MNYAQRIKETYFENRNRIQSHRESLGLTGILTLEHKLKDSYKAYKDFCNVIGAEVKPIMEFLKSEVL